MTTDRVIELVCEWSVGTATFVAAIIWCFGKPYIDTRRNPPLIDWSFALPRLCVCVGLGIALYTGYFTQVAAGLFALWWFLNMMSSL